MKKYSYLFITVVVIVLFNILNFSFVYAQSDTEVDFRKIFASQVALNTQACKLTSPYSNDNVIWASKTYWSSSLRQHVVFAFVLIRQDLLDAALDYWQKDRSDLSREQIKTYRDKLRKMFLKPGLKTFLMLAKPTFSDSYREEWRVEIPDPKEGVTLVTFDGRKGKVVRNEYISDHILYWNSNTLSCLFWVEDMINEKVDPSYAIEISNVFFHIEDDNPDRRAPRYHWLKSTVASFGHVRFETNDVNLLAMIEDNVPWQSIEDKYIIPRNTQLAGLVGSSVLSNIIEAGISFLMRVLFKL